MPQHIRTARPSGDIRGFPFTVESPGITEGQIYMINDTVGVAFQTKLVGEIGTLNYHVEKIMLEKSAALTISTGDKIFWSGTDGDPVTNVCTSGYYWIGICVQTALAGTVLVKCDLKGDKATICPDAGD